jgi:hypothetical protein
MSSGNAMKSYVVVPDDAVEVKARSPFEAARAIRAERPDLSGEVVTVVPQARVWVFDGGRWWK